MELAADYAHAQNVKTLGEQLRWFPNWQKEVISVAGQERGDYILKKTLYIISTGANDWVNNYNLSPSLQKQYNQEAYTTFIVGEARKYIQAQLASAPSSNFNNFALSCMLHSESTRKNCHCMHAPF